MKNIMLFLFILPMFLFSQTATTPTAGDGSSGNPYQIATLENLYWISQNGGVWSSYFIQTANIDASSTSSWGTTGWTPITYFYGTYDGNGFTIMNLFMNRPGVDCIGLFGQVYSGATIKKLGLIDITMSGGMDMGGLAGYNAGTIENCFATGTVTGSNYVGGLVGTNLATGVTRSSYSRVDVVGSECVGSLTGENYNGGTIQNSYAMGNVTGSGAVGGLTGSNYLGTVTNCYSTGSSSGGGLIGASGTCTNSFWDTSSSGKTSSGGGIGKSTAEMKAESTFTNAGWNFITIWEMIGTNYPSLIATTDPALPVELVSITATIRSDAVVLNWQIATEVNNYGFEVERRVAENRSLEVNGSLVWNKVGFVEGNGTTNTPKEYFFSDKNLSAEKYSYRLKQIDRDGKFEYSQEVEVVISQIPQIYALMQNYPNPFNPSTTISFSIPQSGNVSLKVFDALGREVATLVNEVKDAGNYSAQFDGTTLSSGIYFYTIKSGNFTTTKKLVLMK